MAHMLAFSRRFISIGILTAASIFVSRVLSSNAPSTHSADRISPVLNTSFADPAIIQHEENLFFYSTISGGAHVPIATASNVSSPVSLMMNATDPKKRYDALPQLPPWTVQKAASVWAPHVLALADGTFRMYFAAQSGRNPSKHCLGAASAATPDGPFVPLDRSNPWICNLAAGGAIDPSGFRDIDGKVYVVYKVDGNSLGGPGPCGNGDGKHATPLQLQELDPSDGYTKIGPPVTLLDRIKSDGPYIEAPSIARTVPDPLTNLTATYVLFFSSNCYRGPSYNVNYATSKNIKGPYVRATRPLIQTGDLGGLNSPGGATATKEAKRIVFHANVNPDDAGMRVMYTSEIVVDDSGTGSVSLTGGLMGTQL